MGILDSQNPMQNMGLLGLALMNQATPRTAAQMNYNQQQNSIPFGGSLLSGLAQALTNKNRGVRTGLDQYNAGVDSSVTDNAIPIPSPNPNVRASPIPSYAPDLSDPISRIRASIGQFESGNNYNAMGPRTKGGDRAYGRYQVMGNNIPSWSKEILGQEMTPQEFINNPQAQDAIAHARMAQYYKQYGNPQDVAAVWFSGRPLRNNNSRDVSGTSVPHYVNRVNQIYNSL